MIFTTKINVDITTHTLPPSTTPPRVVFTVDNTDRHGSGTAALPSWLWGEEARAPSAVLLD